MSFYAFLPTSLIEVAEKQKKKVLKEIGNGVDHMQEMKRNEVDDRKGNRGEVAPIHHSVTKHEVISMRANTEVRC